MLLWTRSQQSLYGTSIHKAAFQGMPCGGSCRQTHQVFFSQSQALVAGIHRNANDTPMIPRRPRRTVSEEINETTRTKEATINARSNSEIIEGSMARARETEYPIQDVRSATSRLMGDKCSIYSTVIGCHPLQSHPQCKHEPSPNDDRARRRQNPRFALLVWW